MVRWTIAMVLLLTACGEDRCELALPGTVCALAGTGELGYNADGLPGPATDFYLPSAVTRGPDGLIHVMDYNNQRVRVIDATGVVRTVAGSGWHAIATLGVPATESPLENPTDFAFLSDGRLVFTSYHDPRVLMVDHDGVLRSLAGTGEIGRRGDEGDFESPHVAQFIQLDGILVAPDDTIYITDSMANRVRRIRDDVIVTVAGTGGNGYVGDGGPATAAELRWPTALAFDTNGDVLVADTFNHAVRRIAADGMITTIAGDGTRGFGGDGGPATAAQLDQPNGLAVAPDGTLYIADRGNLRIRRVSTAGAIDTIAGTGVEGHSGDSGPALEASFGFVARIALDGDDLLVADQTSSCIRRLILP